MTAEQVEDTYQGLLANCELHFNAYADYLARLDVYESYEAFVENAEAARGSTET